MGKKPGAGAGRRTHVKVDLATPQPEQPHGGPGTVVGVKQRDLHALNNSWGVHRHCHDARWLHTCAPPPPRASTVHDTGARQRAGWGVAGGGQGDCCGPMTGWRGEGEEGGGGGAGTAPRDATTSAAVTGEQ